MYRVIYRRPSVYSKSVTYSCSGPNFFVCLSDSPDARMKKSIWQSLSYYILASRSCLPAWLPSILLVSLPTVKKIVDVSSYTSSSPFHVLKLNYYYSTEWIQDTIGRSDSLYVLFIAVYIYALQLHKAG